MLPDESQPWPPKEWATAFTRAKLDEAFWLNDTRELAALLQNAQSNTRAGDATWRAGALRTGGFVNLIRRWFLGRVIPLTELRTDMPIPIAATVATMSGQMLMAEPPTARVLYGRDAGNDTEGEPLAGKVMKGKQQDRLDLIANSDDAHRVFLEASVMTAALGASVLKLEWDKTDPDVQNVRIAAVGGDCAIPTYNGNRLDSVLMFTEYQGVGNTVWRQFENHRPGFIDHALYKGTPQYVGKQVALNDSKADLGLDHLLQLEGDMIGLTKAVPTGIDRLTAQYWRNRPTISHRRDGFLRHRGRSDFEMIEPLIDGYAEAWASLMRDMRLGKARLLVPMYALEANGAVGQGATFDSDREIFTPVPGLASGADDKLSDMAVVQADIRFEEHMSILAGLRYELLDAVGWSNATYGSSDGGDTGKTATEVVDRTTKSERTRDEKSRYFLEAAVPLLRAAMQIDGNVWPNAGGGDYPDIAIDFPDVSQIDPEKQARTFSDLALAKGISIWQIIRERNPNWDDDEVLIEYNRIWEELERSQPAVTDPTALGSGGQGLEDPAAVTDAANPDGSPTDSTKEPTASDAAPAAPADQVAK